MTLEEEFDRALQDVTEQADWMSERGSSASGYEEHYAENGGAIYEADLAEWYERCAQLYAIRKEMKES